jgi:hypothetical protein
MSMRRKITTTVWYSTDVDLHDSQYKLDMDGSAWDMRKERDQIILAESVASAWFRNGGFEASWPVEFALYETEDGPELARFDVDMEFEPSFAVTKK